MKRAGNDLTISQPYVWKQLRLRIRKIIFLAVNSNCNKRSLLQLGKDDRINLSTIKSMQAGRSNYNNTYTVDIFTN